MYGYPQLNVEEINQQIQRLERLKSGFQAVPQPIQNIINTNTPVVDFEARILKENEKVDEILVQHKTAFIDLKNGYLRIKEINGDVATYKIVKPKDEKDLLIEELERRLNEYGHNSTNYEIEQPRANDNESNEPTTKNNSKSIFKKSQ